MGDRDPRVVIVAENTSARFGGEAILPLHYFRRLRQRGVEAWLVTHARTRDELSALLPDEVDRIVYVADTWLHRLLWRAGRLLPARVAGISTGWASHLLTQVSQRRRIRRLVREFGIDVVHEPIPVSPAMPSMMFSVGAPVVIGPLNGGMSYPLGFSYLERRWERLAIRLGRALATPLNHLIPGKKRAAVVLVANPRTRRALPRCVRGEVIELVENGVDLQQWPPLERTRRNGPITFVFLGRLVRFKAVDLLIEAFEKVRPGRDCRLWIVGDGPERRSLEEKAGPRLHRGEIQFHGFVDQRDCPRLLAEADVMVLPSLYECGGAVVLEAMAMGMPVVATDWGGPADYLNEETGKLVPPTGRRRFVEALSEAMAQTCDQRGNARSLGERARRRVEEHFDWEKKIDRMVELYCRVSGLRP